MATRYESVVRPPKNRKSNPLALLRTRENESKEYWDRVGETWRECHFVDLPVAYARTAISEDEANAIIGRWHDLASTSEARVDSLPGLWPEYDGRSEVYVIWEMRKQDKEEVPHILHRDTATNAFYSFVHGPLPTRKKGETSLAWPRISMDTEANFIAIHKELAEAALNVWGEAFETWERREDLYHDFVWSDD